MVAIVARRRVPMSAIAVSHETRSNSPVSARRRSGCVTRSGSFWTSVIAMPFGTRLARGQRVLLVRAQLRDDAVLDRRDHPAVRLADAAHRHSLFRRHVLSSRRSSRAAQGAPYSGIRGRSTPAGRRSSSSSLSRCAASVTAAAGRRTAGHVGPHPVEQLVGRAVPASERLDEPPLAVQAVLAVLLELGPRLHHQRPVPWADQLEIDRHQALECGEVAAQRARVGIDEDASVAEHRVAAEQRAVGHERDVVGSVPGRRDRRERADLRAVGDRLRRTLPACRGDRHLADQREQGRDALDVVGVVVGQHDARDPAARLRVARDLLLMGGKRRTGIDDPARTGAHEPGVRALERERTRVVGANQLDVPHRAQATARRGACEDGTSVPSAIPDRLSCPRRRVPRPRDRAVAADRRLDDALRGSAPSVAALRRHIDAPARRGPALPSPRRAARVRDRRRALGRRPRLRHRAPRRRAAARRARRARPSCATSPASCSPRALDAESPAVAHDARHGPAGRRLRPDRSGAPRARRRDGGGRGRDAAVRRARGRGHRVRGTLGAVEEPLGRPGPDRGRRLTAARRCEHGAGARARGRRRPRRAARRRRPGRPDRRPQPRERHSTTRRRASGASPTPPRRCPTCARPRAATAPPSTTRCWRAAAAAVGAALRRRGEHHESIRAIVPASVRDRSSGRRAARQPDLVPGDRPSGRRARPGARPAARQRTHARTQARRRRRGGGRAAARRGPAPRPRAARRRARGRAGSELHGDRLERPGPTGDARAAGARAAGGVAGGAAARRPRADDRRGVVRRPAACRPVRRRDGRARCRADRPGPRARARRAAGAPCAGGHPVARQGPPSPRQPAHRRVGW